MQWSISLAVAAGLAHAWASPVDFGMEEWRAALEERGRALSAQTELSLDPPGSFRLVPLRGAIRVSGGDLRGIMYGLIEAAEQMRATGTIKDTHRKPSLPVRGVRMTPTDAQLTQAGFFGGDRWRDYFRILARGRINRLTLVLPLAAADIDRIRFLSRTANDFAVDFTLGLRGPLGAAEALAARLRELLDESVLVRGIEIEPDSEPLAFYRESVIRVVRETGRRVALDLHGDRPEIAKAAIEEGVFVRATADPGANGAHFELHAVWRAPNPAEDSETVRRRLREVASGASAGFELNSPGPDLRDHEELLLWWGRLGYDQETNLSVTRGSSGGTASRE